MLLSWRSRLGLGPNEWLGIETCDEGVALAHFGFPASGPAHLHRCEFIVKQATSAQSSASAEASSHQAALSALGDLLASRRLSHLPCNWLLDPRHYSLLLLEAPRVAAEELHEALRWQIKDLVNFPVDKAVLDSFELPEDGRRGRHMLYVAAAAYEDIESQVRVARQARVRLSSIDIAEFALRNIADHIPSDGRGVAVVRIQRGRGSIVLLRDGQLYLSRHFELPYNGGVDEALPEEKLTLELQRSLDYYERQMAQEAPERILLCGDNTHADKITESMRSSLAAPLEHLPLAALFANGEDFDEPLMQRCVGAIGAALRGRTG